MEGIKCKLQIFDFNQFLLIKTFLIIIKCKDLDMLSLSNLVTFSDLVILNATFLLFFKIYIILRLERQEEV